VNGQELSQDFKDLIVRLFSYNPALRPTIDEIRAHPWLSRNPFNPEASRRNLLLDIQHKQQIVLMRQQEQAAQKSLRSQQVQV
jgi:serine/threonine protein kinase